MSLLMSILFVLGLVTLLALVAGAVVLVGSRDSTSTEATPSVPEDTRKLVDEHAG